MLWRNIILSYISLFALGLADNIRGPIYPELLTYFQVSNSVGALFFGVASLMGLFGSLHTPWILARSNLYVASVIGLLSMTTGLLLMSVSTHFGVLLLGAFFFGYSYGPMGVSQNSLLVQGTQTSNRLKWMSGLHSTYALASLVAPLIVAGVADFESPWRWSLAIVGFLTLATAIVSFKATPKDAPKTVIQSGGYTFTKREFHIGIVLASYVAAEIFLSTRLAQVFRLELGYDLKQSSLAMTAFFALLLGGRVATSFYHFPWHLKTNMHLSLFSTIFFMALGLFLHPLFFIVCGLTMAPFYAWMMTYIAEVFPGSVERTISLVLTIDALFIVSMHIGVGQLTDLVGIRWTTALAPALMICSYFFLHHFEENFEKQS